MKTKQSKKKKNQNLDDQASINSKQSNATKKPSFGDPFKIPCHQVDKIIHSSPMDEENREDLKNGLMSFYEAVKLLLNDIENRTTSEEDQTIQNNFLELTQGWAAYKNDLTNSIKSLKRTNYIDYVHNELLKIAVSANKLFDHPPITPLFRIHGPKLMENLALQLSQILSKYLQLFNHLLNDEQINSELVDEARNPLRKLRQELLTKYEPFFSTENEPNEYYTIFMKYIDRILKKTQHFSTSHSEEIPYPIQEIDKGLTQVQRLINLPEDESTSLLNFNFSESASFIRSNLNKEFDASSSVTGLSIYNFNRQISESYSQVTGIDNFMKTYGQIGIDDLQSMFTLMRDKTRLNAKWYQTPLFATLNETIKILDERAAMISARFTHENIEKHEDFGDMYGELDEIERQVGSSVKRMEQTKNRLDNLEKRFNFLKGSIEKLMKNYIKNFDVNSENSLILKIQFSDQNAVIAELEKIKSCISNRIDELESERSQLVQDDITQKTIGSAMFDEETAITQAILKQHQYILQRTKEMKIENAKLKSENELLERDNFEKQGKCNDLSEKINILDKNILSLKNKFSKKDKKYQWLSGETKRLSFENEHMEEIEKRNKEKFEAKINEINEEIKKLTKLSHRLPQLLREQIEHKDDLEKNVIPELNYKIQKMASILKYQNRQALIEKQKTKNLQIHALSDEINRYFNIQTNDNSNED